MSYCLMNNHVHLLTKPESDESLFKMMQGLTLCYAQHIKRIYGWTGRLWKSRSHSCIVDHERYLWAVARYIEQNPESAGMVEKAEDYPYSSASAHVKGSAMPSWEKNFSLMRNDRTILYCCDQIYQKKKLSDCGVLQKREDLLWE